MLNISEEQEKSIEFLRKIESRNATKFVKIIIENVRKLENDGWSIPDILIMVNQELNLDLKYSNFYQIIRNVKIPTKKTTKVENVETPKKTDDEVETSRRKMVTRKKTNNRIHHPAFADKEKLI